MALFFTEGGISSGLKLQGSPRDERAAIRCFGLACLVMDSRSHLVRHSCFFSGFYDELLVVDDETVTPSIFAFFVCAFALGPLIFQWALFYIITGFPRLLPWQRPEPDEEEWWNQ